MIDVSGDMGGGNVFSGGNYKGEGPLPNANAVIMMPGSRIYADAITNGNGGQVILWSNAYTNVMGDSISARGGAMGGDGGFVETSSHAILDVANIHIDTSAPNGHAGTWLLDPGDVLIGNFVDNNMTLVNPFQPVSGAASGTLNFVTVQNALAVSNLTITTTNAGVSGGAAGNITLDVSTPTLQWITANTLTLQADNNIFLNADIIAPNGGLTLSAVNISTSPAITLNLNTLTLSNTGTSSNISGTIVGAGTLVKSGVGTISLSGNNTYSSGTTINAGTLSVNTLAGVGLPSNIGTGNLVLGDGIANTLGILSYGGATVSGINRLIVLAGTAGGEIDVTNGASNLTWSGPISGSTFTKGGAGALTLTATNSYASGTNINAGTLRANTLPNGGLNTSLGSNNAVTIGSASAATLSYIGNTATSTANFTTSGVGGAIQAAIAGQTLTLSGTINNSGNALTLDTSSGNITVSGAINGPGSLILQGTGSLTINGLIGNLTPLGSLIANTSFTYNGGNITTVGNQIYNGNVVLGADTNFNLTGASTVITFNNGIVGNNITVDAGPGNNIFGLNSIGAQNWLLDTPNGGSVSGIPSVTGAFNFTNIGNITGGNNNDTFTINGGSLSGIINGGGGFNSLVAGNIANVWAITGVNSGTLTGFGGFGVGSFINMQNLVGGNVSNRFNFSVGAVIGFLTAGTGASNNTLDFSAYTSGSTPNAFIQLNVDNNLFSGNAMLNNTSLITAYSNVQNVVADPSLNNIIVLPPSNPGKFQVIATGFKTGFINDPLNFSGFDVVFQSAAAPTPTSPLLLTGFNVASIIQQPIANAGSSLISSYASQWLLTNSFIGTNINDIIIQAQREYIIELGNIKINPFCYSGVAQ